MKFYNIYIEHDPLDKYYIDVISEDQLLILVSAYLYGDKAVTIKGSVIDINNPKKFFIYSITNLTILGTEQYEIEHNLMKAKVQLNGDLMSQKVYSHFGTNVTDTFTKCKGWGSSKQLKSETQNSIMDIIKNGKIFISHSAADSKIVQLFTEHILEIGLGLKAKEDIFNISIEDSGIFSGEKFKDRIENELKGSKAVIQIITENYKKSEACMNEMGAAWILNTKVIPFILNPISFNSVGFIHNTTQLLKLDSKVDLKKFVANFKGDLFPSNYNDSKLDRKIDEFLESINNQNSSIQKEPKKSIIDEHIGQGYKTFQTDNPFIKINNHSNPYYYDREKFREIKDDLTLMFLGYEKYSKANQMNLTNEELKRNLGEPMKSILNAEIWVSSEDSKQWLIYDNYRHHILDTRTVEIMKRIKRAELNIKTVKKEDLERLIQGDIFTLNNKIQ